MLLKRLQARGPAAVHLHASENFRQQIQIAEGVLGSAQDALEWLLQPVGDHRLDYYD